MSNAALADELLSDLVPPGLVSGIVDAKGDDIIAYGELKPDTLLDIGSITKTFTATLFAEMVVRGEVGLADPIGKYLPPTVVTPHRGERQITLLDLATHASGLPAVPARMLARSMRNPADPYSTFTVEHVYAELGRAKLPPLVGQKMSYSNFGYGLLGHILGLVAGMPYQQLVVERVCRPLGLDDTRALGGVDEPHKAQGFNKRLKPVADWTNPVLGGCGCLWSSVGDMIRWIHINLNPASTPLREAIELAQRPQFEYTEGRAIGLGWHHIGATPGFVWHNGGTSGFRSMLTFAPSAKVGVVALTNRGGLDVLDRRVFELCFRLTRR